MWLIGLLGLGYGPVESCKASWRRERPNLPFGYCMTHTSNRNYLFYCTL